MNSQNGVTLTSLAIYIILVLIVLGILATITINFQMGIKGVNEEGTENLEIDKFNMYFLKEVKKTGNSISNITSSEIVFATNNKYSFKETDIYLNDTIKIAEDINKCEFSQSLVDGKTIITVTIKVANGVEKTIDYTLNDNSYDIVYEDEDDYIYVNTEQETIILPNEYRQVKYVTFQNNDTNGHNNCINTLVSFNEADKIEFTYKSVDSISNVMFIAGYTISPEYQPYLAITGEIFPKGFTSVTTSPTSLTREEALDGTKRTIEVNFSSSSTNYISFGSWIDSVWSRTIDWYSFKIWKGDTLLREFVPCYRKSDNVIGMYDIVEGTFYTNCGTGQFLAGPNK